MKMKNSAARKNLCLAAKLARFSLPLQINGGQDDEQTTKKH
jgi:hypothetical protein